MSWRRGCLKTTRVTSIGKHICLVWQCWMKGEIAKILLVAVLTEYFSYLKNVSFFYLCYKRKYPSIEKTFVHFFRCRREIFSCLNKPMFQKNSSHIVLRQIFELNLGHNCFVSSILIFKLVIACWRWILKEDMPFFSNKAFGNAW